MTSDHSAASPSRPGLVIQGIEVREESIPRERLYTADEIFFTGTAAELTPVRSVDRIQVRDGKAGPMTRVLQQRFLGIAQGREPDPYHWRSVPTRAPAPAAVVAGVA